MDRADFYPEAPTPVCCQSWFYMWPMETPRSLFPGCVFHQVARCLGPERWKKLQRSRSRGTGGVSRFLRQMAKDTIIHFPPPLGQA